ncbi:MAG: hypothetical protein PHE49_09490 [bacterium]|nr:hypothetical protein [bacterium]
MAQLSKEQIAEFKKLLEKKSGKELSFAEASEAANNFVGFFELLARIDARNKENKGE